MSLTQTQPRVNYPTHPHRVAIFYPAPLDTREERKPHELFPTASHRSKLGAAGNFTDQQAEMQGRVIEAELYGFAGIAEVLRLQIAESLGRRSL